MPRSVFIHLLALPMLLAMPVAVSAFEFRPGQWQETETGLEDGKPVPPETSTSCMTPEEAKDPLKGLSPQDMKGMCKTYDVKMTGSGMSLRWVCGDPKQMLMDITASFVFASPTAYSGTMKSEVVLMGKKSTMDKKIEGKWIAAQCKK
jgi:hypothetical protein